MTLADFLLARITEDEREAQAIAATLATGDGWFASIVKDHAELAAGDCPGYIAEYDPQYVLVECEAKRRIVEHVRLAEEALERDRADREAFDGLADLSSLVYHARGRLNGLTLALRALASIYVDHPDFDPAWTHETAPPA